MKQLEYQQKAIKNLVDQSLQLLSYSYEYQNLVFKAPTGSGKTIMATEVLSSIHETLLAEGKPIPAFVWIAPQKLHLQSFDKLKKIFEESRKLSPILYDDIDQSKGIIKPGEILFVNWESVNKAGNLMVKERENADSFYEILDRTRLEEKRPIYLIVDEEHRNWSKTADKSLEVVKRIHPKVELRISATPKTNSDNKVTIHREEVVAEQMIKEGIYLNEDIEIHNDDPDLNMHLLHKALDMRNKLAKAYKREGSNVNPLLLIQLPNDSSDIMTKEEKTLAESIVRMLEVQYGITEENGLLGTWLSEKKTIGDEISNNDDITQVLLFKQAIALGWDCPRAAVLLIFRKLESDEFTVQTLGRILRMPEHHFYQASLLNYGHVYTDISRDKIRIASEDDGYISKNTLYAERRDNLNNVSLPSYHQERKAEDRNRIGPDFKKVLLDVLADYMGVKITNNLFTIEQIEGWSPEEIKKYKDESAPFGTSIEFNRKRLAEKGIKLDVNTINVYIPKNIMIQNDEGEYDLKNHRGGFARTQSELNRAFFNYCHGLIVHAHFEPQNSTNKLSACLTEVMMELFGIFEIEVPKVVLSNDRNMHNVRKFTPLIQRALAIYAKKRQGRLKKKQERDFKETNWEVPEIRFYNSNTNKIKEEVKNHALMPYIGLINQSTPETRFTDYLEENTKYIDWWYKNGDEGMTNYSIPYRDNLGTKSLFYVDFIIRLKDGRIFLFDTKSKDSDPEAPAKHNALLAYMKEENAKGMKLDGGILIEDENNPGLWKYSAFAINDTHDISTWQGFFPDQYQKDLA